MSRFSILLAGDLVATPRLAAQLAGTRVLAADDGIRHAVGLGVTPELWLGDFDSSAPADLETFAGVARQTFPAEKDKTDGELAADVALGLGASSLVLAGAFGGPRFDHAFYHLALALRLAERGVAVVLTSGLEEAVPLRRGTQDFDYNEGVVFSILGFSALSGLSVAGARWPLDCVEVPLGSSWTMSNRVAGRLRVTIETGQALLLAQLTPPGN